MIKEVKADKALLVNGPASIHPVSARAHHSRGGGYAN